MKEVTEYLTSCTDLELFQKVKEETPFAFDELYKRYWNSLNNKASRIIGCSQKAEDIVQEIFISVYMRRHKIVIYLSLSSYLNNALRFSISNEYRAQIKHKNYLSSTYFIDVVQNDFVSNVDYKILEKKILQTITILPDKCKKVYLLNRNEGKSYKDISESLNISVSTVEKHIVKALKLMREGLREYRYQN